MPGDNPYRELFFNGRNQPRLWPCAVLFVDLLGVRALATNRRRAGVHLRALSTALRGSIRDFLRDDSPWPSAFFSDALVITAPLIGDDDEFEFSVGGLIAQAAWLQWDLTQRGFFLRGALTIGKLHLYDGLLFGPALVEAYSLESTRAVHPRIILGPALRAMTDTLDGGELLADQDGETFIDYLGGSIMDYVIEPREGLEHHRDLVTARLDEYRSCAPVWEKYRWSAEYHNSVCNRLMGPGAGAFEVDSAATTRTIRIP